MNIKKKIISIAAALAVAVTGLGSITVGVGAADDCNDDWIHAKGSRLYDKDGNQVWLTGANWFGFNCTECVPHYLWSGDIDDMVENGKITATCNFCGQIYSFDKSELMKH